MIKIDNIAPNEELKVNSLPVDYELKALRDLYAQQLNKYDNLLAQFNKREQEYNNSYQNLDFAEKQYKS